MASQLKFFIKNRADFENSNVVITASEDNDTISAVLDRSSRTAWGTSGSTDASNTQIDVNFGDVVTLDTILLLKHNWKSYTIQYYNETTSLYADFSTVINPTNSTAASTAWSFTAVQTHAIRIIIYGTQVANAEKYLFQLIATVSIGQLNGWPVFKKPIFGRNLKTTKMLSGKSFVTHNVGFYATTLEVTNWSSAADLAIVEMLHNMSEGFLFWPCGGDETQFSSLREGYRMEDIFLMRCVSEYSPEWAYGLYKSGLKMTFNIEEVTT